ncbi:U4/U6-U5 snRNP complex subunit LSM8 [Candidozyma auris]|uniref:LSM2-LSM8 complex subunit LSM8 n=2 Tax=Candidozyma auris TaxID=498019 RepID=A0A2H0ZR87_CANAR|nr:hypothetical_protein [[Candida] auris]PIS52682.1 hypothetical protein CJI97_002333 [[Candida] auris]PIS55567.1 hypothetical protein B9J08_001671 [[Candida] auris]QEO19362.1 hypothetical_protein [[Candida] auris]QRG35812.1 hypothetical protein FDK38_000137 [[Candida] auris]QWW22782.1 hypothetical protein CA7LBN_001529 [[Candida] auris]
MSSLKDFLGKKVRIITTDARLFEGKLESFDHSTNLVISQTIERVIYPDDENDELQLGVYLLRGGSVVCVGEIDESVDINWNSVKGDDLKNTRNPL